MNLVEKLAAINTEDVIAAGVHWRVRRIKSADLADLSAALLVLPPGDPLRAAKAKGRARAAPDAAPVMRTPAQMKQYAEIAHAYVCAGLVAASEDGEEWKAIRCCRTEAEADHAASVLWVEDLPTTVVPMLGAAIMKLSTDGGAAAERLASFRGDAGAAPARRRARA